MRRCKRLPLLACPDRSGCGGCRDHTHDAGNDAAPRDDARTRRCCPDASGALYDTPAGGPVGRDLRRPRQAPRLHGACEAAHPGLQASRRTMADHGANRRARRRRSRWHRQRHSTEKPMHGLPKRSFISQPRTSRNLRHDHARSSDTRSRQGTLRDRGISFHPPGAPTAVSWSWRVTARFQCTTEYYAVTQAARPACIPLSVSE